MTTRLGRTIGRYFWGVQFVVVGAVAVLAGWTGASLAGTMMVPQGRAHTRSRVCFDCGRGVEHSERLHVSGVDVLRRNPFCSSCQRGPTPPPEPSTKSPLRLDDAVLVATQLTAGDTDWTLAEVRFPKAGQVRVLGQGSRVADAKITRVTATQVEFVRGGRAGVLALFPGQAAEPPPPKRSTRPQKCPASVRTLGAGKLAIDRSLLMTLIGGLGGTTRDLAVAPLQRNGRLAGLRILRVRPRSVFYCLGLRAKDQVVAVNKRQLTSPDVMLTLLAELPGAHHVSVTLIRRGRPQTLDYSIE